MDLDLLWSSETEVFVGIKRHLEIFKSAYYEILEEASKLHEKLLEEERDRITSGGKYCLLFSLGSRKRKSPFINFYLMDTSGAFLILSSQDPFALGENIRPVNSEKIQNSLYKVLSNIGDYELKDLKFKGTILAKYRFPATLSLFGNSRLFKKEILKENLGNENNLSMMFNSTQEELETILKDWARWKSFGDDIRTFIQPYDKSTLIFFEFPIEFLRMNNDNLVFEIARYLRDRLENESKGLLAKGHLPEGVNVNSKVLTIFSIYISRYPKFSKMLPAFSKEFVSKISEILNFVTNRASDWNFLGGEEIGI